MTMPKKILRCKLTRGTRRRHAAAADRLRRWFPAIQAGSGDQAVLRRRPRDAERRRRTPGHHPGRRGRRAKKEYLLENAIAACMKKQGFTYTPQGRPRSSDVESDDDGADYAQAKKFREKYGFGNYAAIVYPNDPKPQHRAASGQSRAHPTRTTTPGPHPRPARRTTRRWEASAQEKARGGARLYAKGSYTETGSWNEADEKKGNAKERGEQAERAGAQRRSETGALAQSYASCLKEQGIAVTTTQPTGIGDTVGSTSPQTPGVGRDMDQGAGAAAAHQGNPGGDAGPGVR